MLAGDIAGYLAILFHALAAAHRAYITSREVADPDLCTLGPPEVALRALDVLSPPRPPLPEFYRAVAARLFSAAIGESDEVDFGVVTGDTLVLGILILSGLLRLWAPGEEAEALKQLWEDLGPEAFSAGQPA